jgi:hypothetical protein
VSRPHVSGSIFRGLPHCHPPADNIGPNAVPLGRLARHPIAHAYTLNPDNTNANQETREHWTTLAKELSVPVRVIHFLSPPELCKHNATVRAANKTLVRSDPLD